MVNKCIKSIFSGIIGSFILAYAATYVTLKIFGVNSDMAIAKNAIYILGGLIVGCTVFIVSTIKENSK